MIQNPLSYAWPHVLSLIFALLGVYVRPSLGDLFCASSI